MSRATFVLFALALASALALSDCQSGTEDACGSTGDSVGTTTGGALSTSGNDGTSAGTTIG